MDCNRPTLSSYPKPKHVEVSSFHLSYIALRICTCLYNELLGFRFHNIFQWWTAHNTIWLHVRRNHTSHLYPLSVGRLFCPIQPDFRLSDQMAASGYCSKRWENLFGVALSWIVCHVIRPLSVSVSAVFCILRLHRACCSSC